MQNMGMRLNSNDAFYTISGFSDEKYILELIHKICERGSDAEIRRNKDGTYKVYEVKKKIVG